MDTFRSLVQPLVGPSASSAGMIDGMKLVVLGGTVETARRMGSRAWNHFVNSFFLTAHFSEDDYPYDWLMLWLSRRPEWQRSREFETTTRLSTPLSGGSNSSSSDDLPEVYNYDEDDVPGKVKTRVVFQPTFNTTHTIYYRGHWLRVRRWRKGDDMNAPLKTRFYSVVARSNTILKQLVLQAKREYEAEAIHRIQIYFADSHGGWRWTDSRHKRPMSSIVLNPGVKEMLLSDTKDFLNSEKWYADRGIPFRRGYLLHGVPGSGKSSLIHAIAGELMLDIYALSLSAAWINDATLTTLMGRVPARCIVLLEDLDAAFTRSTGRRSKKDKKKDRKDKKDKKSKDKSKSDSSANSSGNTNNATTSGSSRRRRIGASGINGGANANDAMSDVNTLSLSGLLNALDGVAAAEGRLLFATTNHLDHLDPALSRPGRMDVWIDFKNASRWQAEALFRNFFPSCEDDINSRAPTPTPTSPSSSASPKRQPRPKAPHTHSSAPLSPSILSKLAKEFAQKVPDEEFSVASLQGYLLRNKSRPEDAVKGVETWVEEERRNREKQKGAKKKAKEEEERKKRKERRKEKKEKEKEKEKEKIKAEAPAPVVLSPSITAQPLPAVPVIATQEAVPSDPEATPKKSKSKSKSKSRKSKTTSKNDVDNSDSDSSSSSSSDTESSSSDSDSDSNSSSDSSSDDDDENVEPRARQSTTSTMMRTSTYNPLSLPDNSSNWTAAQNGWEIAAPPNGSWSAW
ncbi:P-loop containing nucleoside triphosphate hydrolase protein [Lentinula boryana]|uniref:P-loop containing nucleoside triphosphate hydrolase protein n=1 Tax=Lentinula boryana TaxID=40481 RepID=A0ABQ8QCU6_9AGAR|nr:P-loop containing nucleoside triphosphate hydrolase protein [Lentinula boryana]